MKRVTTEMHCPEVVIAYGQTECAPVMTMTRPDDPQDIRVSTVGRLLPGIEGRIVDLDTNRELPADEQGSWPRDHPYPLFCLFMDVPHYYRLDTSK